MPHGMLRRIVFAGLALILAFAIWFGWETYQVYTGVSSITNVKVAPTKWEKWHHLVIPPLDNNHRLNFLVLGSDNDRKREEKRPLSQSMILVTVNPRNDAVSMVSIPRDFYVKIPGHGWGKIDLAYKYGKVRLARETVERLFHVTIDYYAWVGLNGFIRVIDTFNGVTLDVQYPVLDDGYPNDLNSRDPYGYQRIFIPAGWQHLDGQTALEYVRSRHGDVIGDFGRSQRQQDVLLKLDQKINAMNVLLHLPQLVDDLKNSVRTDLSLTQLYQLERLSRNIQVGNIQQIVLQPPTYSRYGFTKNGQSIVIPNWSAILPVVARVFAPLPALTSTRHVTTETRSTPEVRTETTRTPLPTPTATSRPSSPTPAPSPTSVRTMNRLPGSLVFTRRGDIVEELPGGATRLLTSTGDAAMPAISPNGRSVAFIRFGQNVSDIWVLNLQSHQMRRLTNDTNPLGAAKPDIRNNLWALWPKWSADGGKIVFSWDHAKLSAPASDARPVALALWEIGSGGGNPVQLTQPARGGAGDTDAAWRPGTSQVLYVHWDNDPASFQPYSQLELRDTRTGATWPLTPVGGRVIQPVFSPDGSNVAYIRRDAGGQDQLVVARLQMTSNGPTLGPRTGIGGSDAAQPAFTTDGRWISYVRANGDGFEIAVVPASGGRPRLLSAAGTAVDARWRPIWRP